MKNRVMVGILLFLPLVSFAGLYGKPEQDPVVKLLRNSFAASKMPTEADLELGRKWSCKAFEAYRDSFKNLDVSQGFQFQAIDGFLVNNGVILPKYLSYDSTSVAGGFSAGSDNMMTAIRVSQKGDLIFEISQSRSSFSVSDNSVYYVTDKSIHNPAYVVIHYGICIKK